MRAKRDPGAADIKRVKGISHDRYDHRLGAIGRDTIGRAIIAVPRI